MVHHLSLGKKQRNIKPILLVALAIGLLPTALGAQASASDNTHDEPINLFAEFADLMHGEMDAQSASAGPPAANRFPTFVHYRTVMQGSAADFLAFWEKSMVPSVPPVDAVWAGSKAFTPSGGDCSDR